MLASIRSAHAVALLCCTFAALQACGGRSDTEDYRAGANLTDGGTNSVGATSSTGAVTSGGKQPGGTAGTAVGGSNAAGGAIIGQGGSVIAGGAAQGGAPGQGGVGQAGTGVVAGGVGGVPSEAPITCGASVCDSLSETCCASFGGLGCIPEEEECGGAVLNCGASSDCEGNQVCCLAFVGDVGTGSACKNQCDRMGPSRERQLCATDADCSNDRSCRDTVFGVRVCTRR